MPVYVAVDLADVEPTWVPLQRIADLWSQKGRRPVIDPAEFMYVWRLRSRGRDLHLYKHYWTRRYINLDDAGHTHVFVRLSRARSTGPFGPSIYRPLPDLVTAIDRLLLEDVPVLPLSRTDAK